MILNDNQIKSLCPQHNSLIAPMIDPFIPEKMREVNGHPAISFGCSHFGYDIRLSSKEAKVFAFRSGYTVVDPKRPLDTFYNAEVKDGTVLIPPHHYILGVSMEKFNMPSNVLGMCVGKSTYARVGVIVNVTPLEPGWRGHLTMEIFNGNPLPVILYLEEGICQILFLQGETPSSLYSGKYQDQIEKPKQADV